jgi:glyoxylase-like metal-dependent hydrolase (beta-lactamase superfamily II)
MRTHTFPLGPLETNCYLLVEGNEAVAIDPGGNPTMVVQYLTTHKLKLTAILITHLHFDHVLGVAALARETGATVYANSRNDFMLRSELGSGGGFGLPKTEPFENENLDEGELTLMGLTCKVLATPGHSPGSLSYYFPVAGSVFGGDVLFHRSVGRSDLPGGDGNTLRETIRKKLFTLPPETVVYPGHGPSTTISAEMRGNPFIGV